MRLTHPIPPLFDDDSRILLLGSFPSVKSREAGFYYHHPQNRFWRVLAAVFDEEVPQTIPQRRAFAHAHHIAVWDVIAACEVSGSADADIRHATPNDIAALVRRCPLRGVYCNGALAHTLYKRYAEPQTGIAAVRLPSTSAANAAWSLSRLTDAWRQIRPATE